MHPTPDRNHKNQPDTSSYVLLLMFLPYQKNPTRSVNLGVEIRSDSPPLQSIEGHLSSQWIDVLLS